MDATAVANHVLWRANKDKVDISPMKLQKILYFLHGTYLSITGESLIDEGFRRWDYGPVIPSVYHELKIYGGLPIDDYIKKYDKEKGEFIPFFVNTRALPRFEDILDQVWNKYSKFSAIKLSNLTHESDSPWAKTAPNNRIPDDVIAEYFTRQVFTEELT
jgi:uncharacterized phage-associated protein